MSIQDVIRRARREPPYSVPGPGDPMILECRVVDGVEWSKGDVEQDLGVRIPEELIMLWNNCGGLRLYEDVSDGQWGLVVLSPRELALQNQEYREEKGDALLPGDLIFATFRGDLELSLMRSDEKAADYGRIVIVAEMDQREDWYTAAQSLEEFLTRFMDSHGDKYWDLSGRALPPKP
jgi:hypothetical protein